MAKKGDILFCEDSYVKYKSPSGGSPDILVSMNNWQGGNPIRAEWSGENILIYTEKNWIYIMEGGGGSPEIFKSGN